MMGGALPPVLGRLLRGSFWLALKSPVQALIAFWTFPLTVGYIGDDAFGAYGFAWGFGFLQFLLEFGMSSALQRQISDAWTRGDRPSVERAVACGTLFYAGAAALQAAVLLGIARWGVPYSGYYGESAQLVVKLLLLQAIVSPAYGLSVVAASVLQAARRYDFIPRLDLAIVLLRFLILVGGIWARLPFFQIVVIQIAAQLALGVVPATWVMVRELGIVPRFRGASWLDFNLLLKISLYVFLIQLSVVLADRIDTTILGFALPKGVAGPATTVYQVVSKPFFQIRQTGWMLCYLVMPAVASLAAAQDRAGLERILYDGSRLLIGLLAARGASGGDRRRAFLDALDGAQVRRACVAFAAVSDRGLAAFDLGAGADGDRPGEGGGDRLCRARGGDGEPAAVVRADPSDRHAGGDLGDRADDPGVEPADPGLVRGTGARGALRRVPEADPGRASGGRGGARGGGDDLAMGGVQPGTAGGGDRTWPIRTVRGRPGPWMRRLRSGLPAGEHGPGRPENPGPEAAAATAS